MAVVARRGLAEPVEVGGSNVVLLGSEIVAQALDRLGVLLAEHEHVWSEEDRLLWERAKRRVR